MPLALTAILLALGAEAVAVRIGYDAPADCPNAQAFYDEVRARTEHVRTAVGEEPRMDVAIRVTRTARGYAGEVREIVNDKESAVRSMAGGTCKEVVDALSLTVALSIDPDAHSPIAEPASAARPAPALNRPSAPAGSPAAPVAAAPMHLEVGLGALGTVVDTAGFSLGGSLWATVLREPGATAGSSLQLALSFATTGVPSAPPDHRARFGALALAGCPWRQRLGELELAPCALGMFGILELSGRDVPQAKTVDRVWWSAGLDAELSWLVGHGWVVEGALGATLPLARRRFFTNSADHVVAQTPVVSPLARLGVGFRF